MNNKKTMNNNKTIKAIAYIILIAAALSCVIPFMIIISSSLTKESEIIKNGFSLIPFNFSLEGYRALKGNSSQLISAYMITIITTILGTLLSVTVVCMTAYPLSRRDYSYGKVIGVFFYFTMLFSGGTVPAYIINTKILHLQNNPIVLVIPMVMNVWNVFLMRTYFSKINTSLIEASKLDGAGEIYTLFKIIMPISLPGVATICMTTMLSYWNEWYMCLMYMTNEKIITLQYYLQKIMSNMDAILKNSTLSSMIDTSTLPTESARMAVCVLAMGPMIFAFIFLQKYFIRGIAVGSVK